MPLPKNEAWFPAKTYGYGWGMPQRWQGWVVLFGFVAVLISGTGLIKIHPLYFVGYSLAWALVMSAICWWKGEAPRWQWGPEK